MACQFSWIQDKKLMLVSVTGNISAEDVVQTNEMIAQWITQGNPPVHCIIDISQIGHYPINIELIKQKHPFSTPNAGWVVIVGANAIAKFIATTIMSMFKSQVLFDKTVAEAQATIALKDQTVTV